MKAVVPEQLEELNCQILLGNTYHLGNRPVSLTLLYAVRIQVLLSTLRKD